MPWPADLDSSRHAPQAQPPSQSDDDIPVGGCFSAHIVLGVRHDQPCRRLGARGQGDKSQHERRAVGPSRNTDHCRRLPPGATRQARFDGRQERIM
jgi:hypothetical protein